MRIPLPTSLNPADRSREAARLRLIHPTIATSRSDPHRKTIEVGSHMIVVPSGRTSVEMRVGEHYVVALHSTSAGSDVVVLVDTAAGIREVVGYSREFRDELRRQKFGVAVETVPVEDATSKPVPVAEADRIIALSDSLRSYSESDSAEVSRLLGIDLDGRAFSEGDDAETARLVALADSLGTDTSDNSEADRLSKIAEGL